MSKGGYHTVIPAQPDTSSGPFINADTYNSIKKTFGETLTYLDISFISQALLLLIFFLFFVMGLLKIKNIIKTKRLKAYAKAIKKHT